MSPKTKVSSVRIPLELLNQAKAQGLNLSQILTEALSLRLQGCNTTVVQTNPKILIQHETNGVGSLARTGHETSRLIAYRHDPPKLALCGSISWADFNKYLERKYSESWAKRVFSYTQTYQGLLQDPSGLERLSGSVKNNVLSSLMALAKYLGIYEQFKAQVKACGIKRSKSSSVDSFLRIMGASDKTGDVMDWVREVNEALQDKNLATYLKFCVLSGLRRSEAIESFNLIIALSQERGGLENYYNSEIGALEHFKYPETFLRTTKNAFISLVPEQPIEKIQACEPITYSMLKGRLYRRGLNIRIDELRDQWGTFMLDHGLIKEEVDLLQGRISKSVFVRHYWSPAIKELRDRVFRALELLNEKAGLRVLS